MNSSIPLLGFVATSSNAGKTTLITKLINTFAKRNIRVSVIKHAHHTFDIDHKGKDSYQIREAGAVQTLIASNQRWALMTEMPRTPDGVNEADLGQLLTKLHPDYADIIFVEGFKRAEIPKIEIVNPAHHEALLFETDAHIIAVASDSTINTPLPLFKRDAISEIADFIQSRFLTPRN